MYLHESISLKKTIDRLSRNLNAFNDRDALQANVVEKLKSCLSETSVLIVDGGDITKPCSPKWNTSHTLEMAALASMENAITLISVTALTTEKKMSMTVKKCLKMASLTHTGGDL